MRKKMTTCRINNILLIKPKWVNKEIKKKLKNTLRQMIRKTQPFKIYGMPQKQCLEGSS